MRPKLPRRGREGTSDLCRVQYLEEVEVEEEEEEDEEEVEEEVEVEVKVNVEEIR